MARVHWDVCDEDIGEDPDAVGAWLAEQFAMYNPHGTHGITLWFGPGGGTREDAELRVEADPDAGRAAVRWLPAGLVAVDLPPHPGPLHVCERTDVALVEVPGAFARVDTGTAVRLAAEYAAGGERPGGVRWVPVGEVCRPDPGVSYPGSLEAAR